MSDIRAIEFDRHRRAPPPRHGRHRLARASIAELGLLHPVVVTPKGELIAGERRLRAMQISSAGPRFR